MPVKIVDNALFYLGVTYRDLVIAINNLRSQGMTHASTVQIIRELMGYYRNQSGPAGHSENALFGKFLKKESLNLDIYYCKKIKELDFNLRPTSTGLWKIA